MDDRRRAQRDEAFLVGEIDGQLIYIGDLSETGMKIASPAKVGEMEEEVSVSIKIPSNILPDMVLKGKIVWIKTKNGIYFYGIEYNHYSKIKKSIEQIRELNDFISQMRKNLLS